MASDRWWRSALCAQIDPDIFAKSGDRADQAKAICARCEVRIQCLTEELRYEEQARGIFGGFGVRAREELRRAVEHGADPWEVAISAVERQTRRSAS